MLIGWDDISNDVITLGTYFCTYVCLHLRLFLLRTVWQKSHSSLDREPQGNWRCSCKLSFLFLPLDLSAWESLLAGSVTKVHHSWHLLFSPLFSFMQMAHLASFFLTVNYALTAYMRLREKADTITNLPFSSVSTCIRTILLYYD